MSELFLKYFHYKLKVFLSVSMLPLLAIVCVLHRLHAHISSMCMCVHYAKCGHKVHSSSNRTNPGLCVLRTTVLATEIKTSGFHPLLSLSPLSSLSSLSFVDIDWAERFEYKELRPERRNSRDFREVMKV